MGISLPLPRLICSFLTYLVLLGMEWTIMDEIQILTTLTPGVVTFENYEELKASLTRYVSETFDVVDYDVDGLEAAKADYEELNDRKKAINKVKRELKAAYSAPYDEVEKKLDELVAIINAPLKRAEDYKKKAEEQEKKDQVLQYAKECASKRFGDAWSKVVESPAFFNNRWLNKTMSMKTIQEDINGVVDRAARDITTIQKTGGAQASVLLARYYDTLSMDGMDVFLNNLKDNPDEVEVLPTESKNNVVGYKVLKITATEDQMASILSQLELMGVEVVEVEDGMPREMEERTVPDFDSFVAFDIETTGTYGAASGDDEAQITEIGAVRVRNGQVVEKFDQLANPGRKIVPRIARLTHITDEMVSGEPPVGEVIKMFKDFIGDDILVGHNIKSSDLHYIRKAASKAGVNIDNEFLDTYVLARKFKEEKGWESLKLSYLAEQFGIVHEEAHRAWSDAEVNAQVYLEMKKKLCDSNLSASFIQK